MSLHKKSPISKMHLQQQAYYFDNPLTVTQYLENHDVTEDTIIQELVSSTLGVFCPNHDWLMVSEPSQKLRKGKDYVLLKLKDTPDDVAFYGKLISLNDNEVAISFEDGRKIDISALNSKPFDQSPTLRVFKTSRVKSIDKASIVVRRNDTHYSFIHKQDAIYFHFISSNLLSLGDINNKWVKSCAENFNLHSLRAIMYELSKSKELSHLFIKAENLPSTYDEYAKSFRFLVQEMIVDPEALIKFIHCANFGGGDPATSLHNKIQAIIQASKNVLSKYAYRN